MKWRTLEKTLFVTRVLGLLLFLYSTICFGVLEQYNLDGIGTNDAFALYGRCLWAGCICIFLDCLGQGIKLAKPKAIWAYIFQALVYIASFALVITTIANYPNLICERNTFYSSLWSIDEQIQGVRECVIFDSTFIGGRSLLYLITLFVGWKKNRN